MASKPHKASLVLFASIFYLGWFQEKKNWLFLRSSVSKIWGFYDLLHITSPICLHFPRCSSIVLSISEKRYVKTTNKKPWQKVILARRMDKEQSGKSESLWPAVSESSPPMGASAVLLIDYINNNPFHFSRILLFEDDLLRIDRGFSSFELWLVSPKISALFSTAQSSSVVPAAHTHPPFPLPLVGSLVEQVWRRIAETDAE